MSKCSPSWCLFLSAKYPKQSIRMCSTVVSHPQNGQIKGDSFFSLYVCVSRVCPILSLVTTFCLDSLKTNLHVSTLTFLTKKKHIVCLIHLKPIYLKKQVIAKKNVKLGKSFKSNAAYLNQSNFISDWNGRLNLIHHVRNIKKHIK